MEDNTNLDVVPSDIRDIKRSMIITQSPRKIRVYAIAIHEDPIFNTLIKLPCDHGILINHEAYDVVQDACHVEGIEAYDMGLTPFSYTVSFAGNHWRETVPLPLSLFKKHMTSKQRKDFKKWCSRHKPADCDIIFVQILSTFL